MDSRGREIETGEGDWHTVHRRKKDGKSLARKKWDWPKSVVSFFISNIPDECTKLRLRNECAQFGRVVDTFISNKKGKWGYRFGFVKFDDVRDVRMLERVLGKIKMGNHILSANLEKFDRNKQSIAPLPNSQAGNHTGVPNVWSRLSY
ncbi:hypothetical protein SSX86_022881 [Deinandra increscens subsp. villosa]|uniref:RRM domain-containing protein n=1 Tax=Deinandra increscens subsp. villosa TaxID=3103831 RepID=A0AAP0CLB3_9ASTR